jgi:hypothetical protein
VEAVALVPPIDDERAAERVRDEAAAEDVGDAVHVDRRLVAARVGLVGQHPWLDVARRVSGTHERAQPRC